MKVKPILVTFLAVLFAPSGWAKAENLQHLNQMFSTKQCQKCDLSGSGLVFADLARFDLSGSDLRSANLGRANLTGANLRNANLSGASLLGANLSGADLTGANLTGVDLNSANLSNAKLTNADLNSADLRNSYLVNADLQGANLTNVYMIGAIGVPISAGNPTTFYTWGIQEAQRGNHRAAIEQFNKSLTLDTTFPFSYLGRAISRQRLGDIAGALQDSQQAEKLFKDQKNEEGTKVSQDLSQALQKKPDSGSDTFGDVMNLVGSVLLKFLLH